MNLRGPNPRPSNAPRSSDESHSAKENEIATTPTAESNWTSAWGKGKGNIAGNIPLLSTPPASTHDNGKTPYLASYKSSFERQQETFLHVLKLAALIAAVTLGLFLFFLAFVYFVFWVDYFGRKIQRRFNSRRPLNLPSSSAWQIR